MTYSRRTVLGAAGATAAAGALTGCGMVGGNQATDPVSITYPFRGVHQAGILTPAQDYMFTAAFDVRSGSRDRLVDLLGKWSVAAEQMCAGELVGGAPLADPVAPPVDTGEAWGYPPSGLTITFGVGRSLFLTADGEDRFNLASRMPAVLKDGTPKFANEAIQMDESEGDIVIQACSNDAQVTMHAIRNLTRIGFGTVRLRWSQMGYGRTSSTSTAQETPRNLFGFKDGTNNLKAESKESELNQHVWVGKGDDSAADWLENGSYLVFRKIRMFLEIWDRLQLGEQEETFGRDKRYGAPLSVGNPAAKDAEFADLDFNAKNEAGDYLIPIGAHVREVHPSTHGGAKMLRRGYNYTDGNDSLGRIKAGLFFVAFVKDPRTNFFPILKRMTEQDKLTEYIQHQATGMYAILPGMGAKDTYIGRSLFE